VAFRKAVLSLLVLLLATSLAPAQGTYTQIDYPGAAQTQCLGVNTAGDISGTYYDTSGAPHGFLLSRGIYTTIDYPGAKGTIVFGLNDHNQIVGQTNSAPVVGFVYDAPIQTFTRISYPGSFATMPVSINEEGIIAGFTQVGQEVWGIELAGSSYRRITPRGPHNTYMDGISTAGELVGYIRLPTKYVSFSYARGRYQQMTIPNAPSALVYGISPVGDALVGFYEPVSGTNAGFVFQNHTLQTLQFSGSNSTVAYGVNSTGEVVGTFDNSLHGFSWKPPADAEKK
jgi:hypothetical protein